MSLSVVFAGTPEFAEQALQAIIAAGHEVPLVLTQPDRPSGRGMQLRPSPVKQAAEAAGIAVAQPEGLRLDGRYAEQDSAVQQQIQDLATDVMVVAAYGLIFNSWVFVLLYFVYINIYSCNFCGYRGCVTIQHTL